MACKLVILLFILSICRFDWFFYMTMGNYLFKQNFKSQKNGYKQKLANVLATGQPRYSYIFYWGNLKLGEGGVLGGEGGVTIKSAID